MKLFQHNKKKQNNNNKKRLKLDFVWPHKPWLEIAV
jgi:hypothetical protein